MLRNLIAAAAAAVIVTVSAAAAQDAATKKPPLTNADALSMLQALRNLDGRTVVVNQPGGNKTSVMMPWDFGSGTLRLRIARNVTALAAVEKSIEDARVAIVREILKKEAAGADGAQQTINPGTPAYETFSRQIAEMLSQPAAVDLSRIRASELKLDKNEIPITALSALGPILDDDLTPK
jgi:hypothetical protein